MDAAGGIVELDRLALAPGGGRRLDLEVRLDPVDLGGQRYEPASRDTGSRLDVSRTTTGYALRLRFATEVSGPCIRCLEPAGVAVEVDAREVDQAGAADEELRSPYVADGELDLQRWANDALVLALPSQPLCRSDCAGLCPVCGEPLSDAEPGAHDHPRGGDPRMAKLRDLKLE